MTLSKNKIKYIRSLELKKNRQAEGVFLAEGHKLVGDLLGHFPCRFLAATAEWFAVPENRCKVSTDETAEVSEEELSRASLLKTPQQVLAIFEQPKYPTDPSVIRQSLCLALDDVQDPGNLGTIVRLADWFGIEHIYCSPPPLQPQSYPSHNGRHSSCKAALHPPARPYRIVGQGHSCLRDLPRWRKHV